MKMEQAQEEKREIPTIITVSATELQNNFSKYRKKVEEGAEVIITVNGKEEMMLGKVRKLKFSDLAGMFTGKIGNIDAKDVWEMRRKAYYGEED